MILHRYLILSGPNVVETATSYDDAHQKILARARRTGNPVRWYDTVDTWTDPGEVVVQGPSITWRPA